MTFVLQKFFAAFNRVYEKIEEEGEAVDAKNLSSSPSGKPAKICSQTKAK